MAKGERGNKNVSVVGGGKVAPPAKQNNQFSATSKAEQQIYDLPKNVTRKEIQTMVDDMPSGSIIAYQYDKSNSITAYQKTDQVNAFGNDIWLHYTIHGDGSISGEYDRGTLINAIKTMAGSKNIVKGLSDTQRKKYSGDFASLRKEIMGK